jgi:RNA polymerase sigma-70 factor, ECF subfamily
VDAVRSPGRISGRSQPAYHPLDGSGGGRVSPPEAEISLKPEEPPGRSHLPMGSSAGTGSGAEEESRWIEQARAGDAEAFRMLVERHRDRAYGLALRIVRSPADAEDVAQEAFLRAWRALPRFRGDSAFGTWLHRIVARRALDRAVGLRGRRLRETSLEESRDLAERAASPPAEAPLSERLRLERLLGSLSAPQRAAVTLYYYEDRSVDQVASILGMPVNTVKTHLSRARAALREAWRREETP